MPEFVPLNCQILLLLTTDWFQTVSHLYIIFFVHSGLCLEKHANWFLGDVIELLLYTIKSPDYSLSIDQPGFLTFFIVTRKIKHLKGVEHAQRNPDGKETIQTERHLPLQLLKHIIQLWFYGNLRACSHEPRKVNYPGAALPRVHMMICCSWATFPRVNFITPGQVHPHLITTNLSEFL